MAAPGTLSEGLDNPVWASLSGAHVALARRGLHAGRYAPEVAPFAAVDRTDALAADELKGLVAPGETVLLVGPAPRLDAAWQVEPLEEIAQMTCREPVAAVAGPPMIELDERHRADVLDLTARVYPHYFRPLSVRMGRYFGIYEGAKLAAMAGERMRFDAHVELSAICTDPACLGRGYARRLVAMLANDILDRGGVAFLHVSHRNVRAKSLYERLGFRLRRDMALLSAQRTS
jgi:GNAT superfamily N-acetyltransferase